MPIKKLFIILSTVSVLFGADSTIVAHWSFNGDFKDKGPYEIDLAPPKSDYKFGEGITGDQCLLLDGETYLEVVSDNFLNIPGPFSIEVWLWVDELPEANSWPIIERMNIFKDDDIRRGYSLYINKNDGSSDSGGLKAGRIRCKIGYGFGPKGTGWIETDNRRMVPKGRWNYVVTTFDKQTALMYMDGKKIGSSGKFNQPVRKIKNMGDKTSICGKTYSGVPNCIKGKIDELIIRNVCLTPEQIAANYAGYSDKIKPAPKQEALIGFDHAKTQYKGYTGWTVSEKPVLPKKEVHPSMWFKSKDIAALKAKKDKDVMAKKLWQLVSTSEFLTNEIQTEDAILGYWKEFKDPNYKYIQRYYAHQSQIAKYCAFMYLLTDDARKKNKYKERAISVLMRAYDGPIYEFDPRDKTKVDEIYRGTWMQNFCSAYDFIKGALNAQQDKIIRERLVNEAEVLYEHLYMWGVRPHNHLSKPAWGLCSAALCFSSHPNAEKWLKRGLGAANWNTRYQFSGDGIYREGSHYFIFSWINFMPFLYHYKNVSGVDLFPDFQPAIEAAILTRNGKGWMPNIEDSYLKPFPSHVVASQYKNAKNEMLHTTASLAELCTWHYDSTDMKLFDDLYAENGWNYSGASWDYTMPLDEYMTYTPGLKATAPDTSPTIFLEGGQTVFRNSWENKDGKNISLLFHGVATSDNHDHADHLTFTLFAYNQMMASDSGYGPGGFHKAERTEYNIKPWAHNSVMFNGKYLVNEKENQTPPSRYRMNSSVFDFEEKEAVFTSVLSKRNLFADGVEGTFKRAVAFPGEKYFIILDQIMGKSKGVAELFFHGGKGKLKLAKNNATWYYDKDRYGDEAAMHTWLFTQKAKIKKAEGNTVYIKNEEDKYPYIHATAKGKDVPFMQVIFPSTKDEKAPAVMDLSAGGVLAASVDFGSSKDVFFHQMKSGKASIGGIESDGTFAFASTSGGKLSYCVAREATKLTVNGVKIFDSTKPATVLVDNTGDALVVTVGSTEATDIKVENKDGKTVKADSYYKNVIVSGNTVTVK